jgi:hypothetical protein
MKAPSVKPVRCAIYTRVSTEHGLASIRAATCSKRSAKRTWRLRRLCPWNRVLPGCSRFTFTCHRAARFQS